MSYPPFHKELFRRQGCAMAWPFPMNMRPLMRIASYWLHQGWDEQRIVDWARESRHGYDLEQLRQAIPEAARGNYFAAFVRDRDPNTTFGQLWFSAARGAWYAGYGRAPNVDERDWAYTRPQGTLGLMMEVTGRGTRTGTASYYTITVNADWNSSPWDVYQYVRDCVASGSCLSGDLGSEPLNWSSIEVAIIGSALVARQEPTITVR